MAFGIIHYMFLLDAIVMSICMLLLVKKYLADRNKITLLFTLFIMSFAILCVAYFARGFFEVNTIESILMYRVSLVVTAFAPVLLATFILYPLILQKGGFKNAKLYTPLTILLWAFSSLAAMLIISGDASFSFSTQNMDVYSVSFGPLSYIAILLAPLSSAIIDALLFGFMAYRESEGFYRTRAIFLFLGWLLAMIGQLTLLSVTLMILNPLLFGAGVLIMAAAILRKNPTG